MPEIEDFDWVSPTLAVLLRLFGKTDTIVVPGQYESTVRHLMKKAGIKIVLAQDTKRWFGFDVPKGDVKRARKLIEDHFKK